MKAFDLEKALAGSKVVTRNGLKVTQITKFDGTDHLCHCLSGVAGKTLRRWYLNGGERSHEAGIFDLFMAPKVVTKWINLFPCGPGHVYYDSEEEAKNSRHGSFIATVKVEWEG